MKPQTLLSSSLIFCFLLNINFDFSLPTHQLCAQHFCVIILISNYFQGHSLVFYYVDLTSKNRLGFDPIYCYNLTIFPRSHLRNVQRRKVHGRAPRASSPSRQLVFVEQIISASQTLISPRSLCWKLIFIPPCRLSYKLSTEVEKIAKDYTFMIVPGSITDI